MRIADVRITALIDVVKALRVKFYENYPAGVVLDGKLTEILKGLDDPSNLLPNLGIVKAFLAPIATLKWHSSSAPGLSDALSPQVAHSGRWF